MDSLDRLPIHLGSPWKMDPTKCQVSFGKLRKKLFFGGLGGVRFIHFEGAKQSGKLPRQIDQIDRLDRLIRLGQIRLHQIYIYIYVYIGRQVDRQIERSIDRQTDKQIDERQLARQIDSRQIDTPGQGCVSKGCGGTSKSDPRKVSRRRRFSWVLMEF